MGVNSAEVEEIKTKLMKDMHVDIRERPEHIKNWFSENILKRALAYLVGLGEDDLFHLLRTDANGNLKVVNALNYFSDYEFHQITADNSNYVEIEFSKARRRLDIYTTDNGVIISLIKINNEYGDDIIFNTEFQISIDMNVRGIRIKSLSNNSITVNVIAYS